MSTISAGTPVVAESVASYYNTSKKDDISITKKEEAKETEKKTKVSGRTIGAPELSENAAKYYEQLKKKYGNLDFILVSRDQKEFAKANASKYSNTHKMVVLIDEDKIERMAEDEDYRKQYESIIAKGASGLSQLTNKLANMGLSVKSCGMKTAQRRSSRRWISRSRRRTRLPSSVWRKRRRRRRQRKRKRQRRQNSRSRRKNWKRPERNAG